jgi:hypothetical protein
MVLSLCCAKTCLTSQMFEHEIDWQKGVTQICCPFLCVHSCDIQHCIKMQIMLWTSVTDSSPTLHGEGPFAPVFCQNESTFVSSVNKKNNVNLVPATFPIVRPNESSQSFSHVFQRVSPASCVPVSVSQTALALLCWSRN